MLLLVALVVAAVSLGKVSVSIAIRQDRTLAKALVFLRKK